MKKNSQRGLTAQGGFTLIELLVVIAIIGVLASVVLGALNSARDKAADTAIKADLNHMRAQGEIFYDDNNSRYLPAGGVAITTATDCPAYSATGTSMVSKDKVISDAIANAMSQNILGKSACYNSATAWAIAVTLKSSDTSSWCVDSTGTSKEITISANAPAEAISNTTGACI